VTIPLGRGVRDNVWEFDGCGISMLESTISFYPSLNWKHWSLPNGNYVFVFYFGFECVWHTKLQIWCVPLPELAYYYQY